MIAYFVDSIMLPYRGAIPDDDVTTWRAARLRNESVEEKVCFEHKWYGSCLGDYMSMVRKTAAKGDISAASSRHTVAELVTAAEQQTAILWSACIRAHLLIY